MKLVIQRVIKSSVAIDEKVVGEIKKGYCVLVGFRNGDTQVEVKELA